jgi:PST family polysaccharide transporter
MQLRVSVIKGVKWSSVSQLGRQIIQYSTTLFLASVLSSKDFGLMAMSMVIIGFVEVFKDLGTGSAIIQIKEARSDLISSLFWVNVCFGFILATVVFLLAPFIASFFSNTSIKDLLRVLAITFFISSLSIVNKSVLEKNLQFDKLAKAELFAVLVGAVTAVIFAVNNYGVWSLVFQTIASSIMLAVSLWIYTSWKPQLIINLNEVKSVAGFSANLVGYNIFNYFIRNLDYILIGKFLGDQVLGHYYLVYKIMLYPVQNITAVISRVMFPVYSKLQSEISKFNIAYIQSAGIISLITFPLMFGLFAVSDSFVNVFFLDNWDVSLLGTLLMILAPIGLVQSVCATTGPVYMAMGRTDWLFRWGIFSGLFVGIGFVVGLNWGVTGVALSYLFSTIILIYPCFAFPFKLIKLKFIKFIRVFHGSFISSVIMAIVIIISDKLFLYDLEYPLIFILSISLGALTYIILNFLINQNQLIEFFKLLKIKRSEF